MHEVREEVPISVDYKRIGLGRLPGEGKLPNAIESDENGIYCTDENRKRYGIPPRSPYKNEMAQAIRLLVDAKRIINRDVHLDDLSM